ncbi:uncharacterized protein LOC119601537 [Lucilia sericata]|uniref:uncharacterized protein LOC119601537 n=1 Tax=Lucilia sericata TaxID=13632 RepID=UPI0018A845AB|nr:uncharacterized protein LOC119601537 [Lucilia sericata]
MENQINWFDYGDYKILDVHEKLHQQVQQYLLKHFYNHRIFQVLKLQQEADIEKEFLKIVKHILENESSILVMDLRNNEIKGVALLMCMTQKWRSWMALQLLIENERFRELCDLIRWCLQQQTIRHPQNPGGDSLHLFSFHVCEELQENKEFMCGFFKAICEVCRHMHMPRVTYLCLAQSDRDYLNLAEFKEMVRIIYSIYTTYKGRRPFDRLRDINEMYGGFYEKKVEILIPYQDMLVRHVVRDKKEVKQVAKKTKEENKEKKVADKKD